MCSGDPSQSVCRILLRPPAPLGAERDDDDTYQVVSDWAREQDVEVLLVTGLQVQLVGRGTVTTDELATMRRLLAHRDPTQSLAYAASPAGHPFCLGVHQRVQDQREVGMKRPAPFRGLRLAVGHPR